MNESFAIFSGQATDVGRARTTNEDSFLSNTETGLWVVADGMGGHTAGDYASQAIVRELNTVGLPTSVEDLQSRVMERLTRANERILDHAISLEHGAVGSTVAALMLHDRDYICLWSGDSRVYLLRGDSLLLQTRDHTEVQDLLDAGMISDEDARQWPRRNVITRAIGVTEELECEQSSGQAEVGDMFLLCSDGLTEHVDREEIAEIMRQAEPQEICDKLVELTLSRGGRDNVTVIAVKLLPAPELEEETGILDLLT